MTAEDELVAERSNNRDREREKKMRKRARKSTLAWPVHCALITRGDSTIY